MLKEYLIKELPNLQEEDSVGIISNYLTEQSLNSEFNLIPIPSDSFFEILKKNEIKTIFLESLIYETDHPWFDKSYKDLTIFLDMLGINIVIVTYGNTILDEYLEKYFIINIDNKHKNIKLEEQKLLSPPFVNETIYNPINNESSLDIVYFKFGKIVHNKYQQKLHKSYNPKYEEWDTPEITRIFLKDLLTQIKKSKVLYLYYSDEVDITFLSYIEIIATLNNTIVIIDPDFKEHFNYGLHLDSHKLAYIYISSFMNNKLQLDQYIIPKTRKAFLDNTRLLKYKKNNNSQLNNINISVITCTKRKGYLNSLIDRINSQRHVNLEIVLLTHGFTLNEQEKNKLIIRSKFNLKILEKDESTRFGLCLNECVMNSNYEYITKMDDDDYYYPNYLIDSWIALKYSEAKMVGKTAFFYYLEKENFTAQKRSRSTFRYVNLLKGNTLFLETPTMKEYMFSDLSRHVDSDLINRIRKDERDVYGFHPYDMCVYRAEDKSSHTYKASDGNFIVDSKILFYGEPNETIITEDS